MPKPALILVICLISTFTWVSGGCATGPPTKLDSQVPSAESSDVHTTQAHPWCFPEYYLELDKILSGLHMVGEEWHGYICDDTMVALGFMGSKKHPNLITNQVWNELRCDGQVLKVYVVNCNEA